MVQLEDGYLRIANELWDQILRRDFNKNQIQMISLIIRLSYGCGKRTCIIPKKKDFEVCGIDQTIVERVFRELERANVLERKTGRIYWLNKDHKQWAVSYSPARNIIEPDVRLKGLIRMNIEEPDEGRAKQGDLFPKGKKKRPIPKDTGEALPKDHPFWEVCDYLEKTTLDTNIHGNPKLDQKLATAVNILGGKAAMRIAETVITRYKTKNKSVPNSAYMVQVLVNKAAEYVDVKRDFNESDIDHKGVDPYAK